MKKSYFLRLKNLGDRLIYYYPFTIPGSMLFILCLYLLGRSFASGNPYGFFLSAIGLLVLISLSTFGRIQAGRPAFQSLEWDSTNPIFAGSSESSHLLIADKARAALFFRIHFCLGGKLIAGRNAFLYPFKETAFRGGENVSIPLCLPSCGVFHAEGLFKVKDIFGLSRAAFGEKERRLLDVRPARLSEKKFPTVEALDGLEQKSRFKHSDIERYFMREYMPGDKFRDINWKASGRFLELFTRISPVTQEKTRIISVFLRPYSKIKYETIESIAHLNYIKSWLMLFLKSVKQINPEFQFNVTVDDESYLLENEEDLDRFAVTLGSVFFRRELRDVSGRVVAGVTGEVIVFSTVYDESLSSFIALLRGTKVHLFRTLMPGAGGAQDGVKLVRILRSESAVFFTGPWLLRRDRITRNPPVRLESGGFLDEDFLDVRVI